MTAEIDSLYAGQWREMTIVRGDKTYVGHWLLSNDEPQDRYLETVTVWMGPARMSIHLGGMRPERLAWLLLTEISEAAEALLAKEWPAGAKPN